MKIITINSSSSSSFFFKLKYWQWILNNCTITYTPKLSKVLLTYYFVWWIINSIVMFLHTKDEFLKILKCFKNGCTQYTIYIVYIFVSLERAHWYTILLSFFFYLFIWNYILKVQLYSTEFKKIDVRQVVVTSKWAKKNIFLLYTLKPQPPNLLLQFTFQFVFFF